MMISSYSRLNLWLWWWWTYSPAPRMKKSPTQDPCMRPLNCDHLGWDDDAGPHVMLNRFVVMQGREGEGDIPAPASKAKWKGMQELHDDRCPLEPSRKDKRWWETNHSDSVMPLQIRRVFQPGRLDDGAFISTLHTSFNLSFIDDSPRNHWASEAVFRDWGRKMAFPQHNLNLFPPPPSILVVDLHDRRVQRGRQNGCVQ